MSKISLKIQITRSEIIAKEIIKTTKDIDKKIESFLNSSYYSLYALPFAWNVRFLLTRSFAKMLTIPRLFRTFYDFYILYFLRLGIIRSVRYMGSQDIPANNITLVKKLKIQKDEKSRIGEELVGCFISHGQLESKGEINYDLLLSEYFYMGLIKPLLNNYKDFSAILPTPFSTMSILTGGKKWLLVPCSLMILINYTKATENRGHILGEKLDFIETDGYVLGCWYDERSPKIIKCKPFGPFKVIIPKIEQVDETLYNEYYQNKKNIITNVTAIVVLGENYILPNYQNDIKKGFILIFCEVPFNSEISAFIHLGELINLVSEDIKLTSMIKVRKDFINIFKNKIFRTINYCKRIFNSEVKIINDYGILHGVKTSSWMQRDKEFIYLYTPPLTSLSIVDNVDIEKILDIIDEFTKNKKLLVFDKQKHSIWLKIIRSNKFFEIFHDTFRSYKNLSKIYNLYTVI